MSIKLKNTKKFRQEARKNLEKNGVVYIKYINDEGKRVRANYGRKKQQEKTQEETQEENLTL